MGRLISWRYLLYGLYALLLIAILLYARFPAESYRQYCQATLQRHFPEWETRIGDITFHPSGSMVFHHIALSGTFDGKPSALLVNKLTLQVNPRQFPELAVAAELYSGRLTAELVVNWKDRQFRLDELHLAEVALAQLVEGLALANREVTGDLEFIGNYQASWDEPTVGRGQGKVVISSGSFGLLQPILSLATLEFSQLNAEIEFQGKDLQLLAAVLNSQTLGAQFSGKARLAPLLPESELALSGLLKPEEAFLKANPREQMLVQRLKRRYNTPGLPFLVGGTVSGPTFRFGGE